MRAAGQLLLPAMLCLATPAPSQDPPRKPVVAVVGASVSAGFVNVLTDGPNERNRTVRLATALTAVWPRDVAQVRSYSDVSMFLGPRAKGEVQIGRAAKAQPDLVIGIDFMFWFGYGRVVGGSPAAVRAARLQRQAEGLALLEELKCPLVLGDYPDMAGADRRMISPHQIPTPEVLEELNARLGAWAKTRSNVVVFPLAAWVTRAKATGDAIEFDGRQVEIPTDALLQTDLLHATRLGVVLMAHRLLEHAVKVLPQPHPLRTDLPDLTTVLERSRADVDLPGGTP